jgi:hypothetical protein
VSGALRNVLCIACGYRKPERSSVRSSIGRVNVWLCRECAKDPEAGIKKRKVKNDRA